MLHITPVSVRPLRGIRLGNISNTRSQYSFSKLAGAISKESLDLSSYFCYILIIFPWPCIHRFRPCHPNFHEYLPDHVVTLFPLSGKLLQMSRTPLLIPTTTRALLLCLRHDITIISLDSWKYFHFEGRKLFSILHYTSCF